MDTRAPKQSRSQRTLDAILNAAETLLQERRFESISVAEIISVAGCSNGSFYARFASKDDLLTALYGRYHQDMPGRLERIRASVEGQPMGLKSMCGLVVDEFAASFASRLNLMRALVIYSRVRSAEVRPLLGERANIQQQMVDLFRPFHAEIRRYDPEETVRTGLLLAATAIREAVLFPDAPFAAVTGHPINRMKCEIATMFFAYLTATPES